MISSRSKRYWRSMFEGENGDFVKNMLTDGQWNPRGVGGCKYGIEEPYRPFQDAGYEEDGPPTEKQNKLFNKYCHTKNINYYDGEDSLELLFKHTIPRLKKGFSLRQLGLIDCSIEEWRSWHPDQTAKWLFRDVWFTLKIFYEPTFWERLFGW
ncbi:hypothetical protein LCGC14_0392940 [marine sediment metagenome]|uniref:Uncharacterized protein n=1 Tax=marine sediment metagenome TaxID=412755 RepID=A0A0F9W808_9ZZZZ